MARRNKHSQRIQEAAAKMVIAGIAGLLAPFVIQSALLRPVIEGLQPLAWLALVLGAVLAVFAQGGVSKPASKTEKQTTGLLDLLHQEEKWQPLLGAHRPSSSPALASSLVHTPLPHPLADNKSRTERELETELETELEREKALASAQAVSIAQTTIAPVQGAPLWSASVLGEIEWRRFEAVVERLFQHLGFDTKAQTHGADAGVDIWLYSRAEPGRLLSIVQCKHWYEKRVGVAKVRELRGVMASHEVERGQFVSSSGFTADAQIFAEENGISLMDGAALLKRIASCTPEQQADLLQVAHEGEYWRPTCASCGVKLVERKPRQGGGKFWGCPTFPRCKTTIPMRTQTAHKSVGMNWRL